MSVDRLLTMACTVKVPTAATDDYDQTPGAPAITETVCMLEQDRSEEGAEGAAEISDWKVYLPAAMAGIDGRATLEIDGREYELAGDPWPVQNPRLRTVSHVEARVRRLAA